MSFPATKLTPRGGEIYSHIFENEASGLQRGHFWSITVNFEPLDYADETWNCSMTCEWLQFDAKRWTDLDNRTVTLPATDQIAESSFYMTEHDWASSTKLTLNHAAKNRFRVQMSMFVDFHGCTEDDADPGMLVTADTEIEYSALLIVPDSLFPEPNTPELATRVVSEFADVATYEEPIRYGRRFVFKPQW
jgi:hypothetical protein